MDIRFMYRLFKSKEEAKAFQKERGGGKIYDLEREQNLPYNRIGSIAILDWNIRCRLTKEDKYSVEWNEVFNYE